MGNQITELASYFQPLCQQFLDETEKMGIPCLLVDTGRTKVEQVQKLKDGVSWTQNSKHLPQKPEGKSEAFDVCPKEYLTMKGWNPSGPLWPRLGKIGERMGLHWGGRWPYNPPHSKPDPGHFQYEPASATASPTTT